METAFDVRIGKAGQDRNSILCSTHGFSISPHFSIYILFSLSPLLLKFFFHIGHYRVLSTVPWATQ